MLQGCVGEFIEPTGKNRPTIDMAQWIAPKSATNLKKQPDKNQWQASESNGYKSNFSFIFLSSLFSKK